MLCPKGYPICSYIWASGGETGVHPGGGMYPGIGGYIYSHGCRGLPYIAVTLVDVTGT